MNPPYRAFSLDKKLLELQPFTTYKKIQKQITLPTFYSATAIATIICLVEKTEKVTAFLFTFCSKVDTDGPMNLFGKEIH